MGLITAGMQLADTERVTEYAAIQATVVGLRGMIAPYIGVGLMSLGMPDTGVFILSSGLMMIAWVLFGKIQVPLPNDPAYAARQPLRYRWPIRFRAPRI